MGTVTPFPLHIVTVFPEQRVTYFPEPVIGPRGEKEVSWLRVDIPDDVPTYSMHYIQDMYLTSDANQFLLPLFLRFPEELTSVSDVYHTIQAHEQYRPDLISYRYYSTEEYAWIILFANNIVDPFSLVVGTILRIPSQEHIIIEWLSRLFGNDV